MKKTSGDHDRGTASGTMRREYRFDYRKARPNRFAGRDTKGMVVVLEKDVVRAFPTPEAVHAALRALMSASKKKKAS
jgi:hypothetical protein